MPIERPARRMTLRQQLTHAEKCSRDILEHINGTVLPIISDLRDLSQPVRRRTHFPTMFAFYNALKRLQPTSTDALEDLEYLHGQLEEILEHARRERIHRK